MKLPIYQIDAFADQPFQGNPAAVVPLEDWLPDTVMQSIAEENNLAETAFFVLKNETSYIRWFTPTKEVKLCGHATLAAAYVLFHILAYPKEVITSDSLSGPLYVSRKDDLLILDFPARPPIACPVPEALIKGLGSTPVYCLSNENFVAVFETEEAVRNIVPNHTWLSQLDLSAVIVTSPSDEYDFIARVFAPNYGIPEDHVTGSAYTELMPYWSERLGRSTLNAKQISARGGKVFCEQQQDRVLIGGRACKYMEGWINVNA